MGPLSLLHGHTTSSNSSLTDGTYPSSTDSYLGKQQPSTATYLKKSTAEDPTTAVHPSGLRAGNPQRCCRGAVWPSTTRRGCFFHHKKSLFKHLKQSDLVEEYLVPDSPIREFYSISPQVD